MTRLPEALLLATVALAACGRSPAGIASSPAPVAEPGQLAAREAEPPADSMMALAEAASDSIIQDSVAEAADSAADQAALAALDQLELGSLDRRSGHVSGTVGVPAVTGDDVNSEATGMFKGSRGGAASVAGPTYDIDVETFASHVRVQAYVDYYLGPSRERFGIWLGRMARYEGMARDRFRLEGIPEDMVYLGLIESGFSPTAVSRAKAVGMWQFMPYTGKIYGLHIDQWVDERRDPFKATDAAARLLFDLNEEFGSWYLAAAAYNGGAGRVSRGLRRLPKSHEDSVSADGDFFRLSDKRYLKRETRDYVPKLIAAALIAKEPSRYGFDSIPELPPLIFDEVTISEQTGLDVIARLADTTTTTLTELNPQLYRGVTPPSRPVIVRVPRGTGDVVARRWAELPASERVTVIEHVIARGETIGGIAKRYRVDASYIMAANPRLKPRALRIGQRVIIPVSLSARARVRARPATTVRARAASTAPASRYHVVRWGESLWTIARRYGVRVADLREWNDIAAQDVLKPGVRLIVVAPPGGAD